MPELLAGGAALLWSEWATGGSRLGRTVWWTSVAVVWAPGGQFVAAAGLWAAAALQWLPDDAGRLGERKALCRFWQAVALLASSGIPLLAAVEEAAPAGPLGAAVIALAHRLSQGDPRGVEEFVQAHNTVEGRQVAQLLRTASEHGLDPEAAHAQGLLLWERLAQEERLREAKRPLWTAALPGALLLMVLVVFLVPLASFLISGWSAL